MTRLLATAAVALALGACSSRSTTCACTRPDGGTDLIDIKGGSCAEFEGGQQGYTNCAPVVVFNTILGPGEGPGAATTTLPSFDQAWQEFRSGRGPAHQ